MRPLRSYKNRRRYWRLKDQRLERQESLMLRTVRKFMQEQKERILDRIPDDRKGFTDTIFNQSQEKKLMAEAVLPTLREVLISEGESTAERLGGDYSVSATAEQFIQRRSNNLAGQVTDTTFEGIKNEIEEGYREGESYSTIAGRIDDRYEQINEGRANTIARTEAHNASVRGNVDGYKQSGVRSLIWVAVMDTRTRPSHQMVDGEEVKLGQTFSNGLRWPGDPRGPASEVVNCRCQA